MTRQSLISISKAKLLGFLLAAGLISFSACEVEAPTVEFVVEEPLQAYFERFIDEAATRGLDVEYATYQVDARIGDITEPNVIGTCSWSQTHKHSITIDRHYWRTANDLQREFVIFHELGHCVLGRNHVDASDTNGNCASIMSSGTGGCRVIYNHVNRKRLVDELFSN